MTLVTETRRLVIRHFEHGDTPFIIRLLNEESFIRYIADKNVHTTEEALNYLTNGPIASYHANGFGLNMVELKACGTPIGMCGVIKRPELQQPDLGYAFLPEHWRKGYAEEAAIAVLHHAFQHFYFQQLLAITLPNNQASNALLKKIGFTLVGSCELYGDENNLYQYRHKKS